MAAELQVQLMNELLSDNDALTKAVGMATREKAELCRTVSRLEKTLKHHSQKGCVLNVRICVPSLPRWFVRVVHSAGQGTGLLLPRCGPVHRFSWSAVGLHPV